MANVSLAAPHSISSAVITSTVFGSSGSDFYIKVGRARVSSRIGPIVETTGDGDSAPAFETGYWQYTNLAIAGWMPAAANDSSLTNLTATAATLVDGTQKNPLTASIKLSLASNHHITIPANAALITQWEWEYQRQGGVIPVFVNIITTHSLATWSST